MGPVERAVRAALREGQELKSVARQKPFLVVALGSGSLDLAFGEKQTLTRMPWDALERVPEFLQGRGWVRIAAVHSMDADPDTFDGFLKSFVPRSTGSYVPTVLQHAGIVEVDPGPPSMVRLVG